jgi:hypothetical protein
VVFGGVYEAAIGDSAFACEGFGFAVPDDVFVAYGAFKIAAVPRHFRHSPMSMSSNSPCVSLISRANFLSIQRFLIS